MINKYGKYFLFLIVLFLLPIVVLSGNSKTEIAIDNLNTAKSLQAMHIVNKYEAIKENEKVEEIPVFNTFQEAMKSASTMPVAFMGKLTAYGPDCKGCGGGSACPPRQNFKNGNIYFNDQTYGKIRVVAADRSLPCGSIVRMTGISIYSEPVIAVVMDRGGAVKGAHLDLLFTSQKNLEGFKTSNNIKFEILRYGW